MGRRINDARALDPARGLAHTAAVATPAPRRSPRRLGPRGLQGVFGWTFFDPANLVAVTLWATSLGLVVHAMRGRGAPDWPMAALLYLAMAGVLRAYFFAFYHGGPTGRLTTLLMNLVGFVGTAALWADRASAHSVLRPSGLADLPESPGLRWAAILHMVVAFTLCLHLLLPRAWLIRTTDGLADRSGRDAAPDAPLDTIDDPEARAARAAEEAARAQKGS